MSVSASFAHPLWLGALLVLGLNDHVLKGAGWLPGAITGKLSDVAGLLVAPLVLAWLVRARSPRGWLAVHLAVGAGFALVQLAPAAHGLEELGRALGLTVRLWPDPSDLAALPALVASHRWLARRAERPSRALGTASGLVALVLCTATPAPGGSPPPRYPFPPAGVLETDAYVRHTGSEDLEVRIHRLKDEVTVDCDGLLDIPERMLEDGDFGEERAWTLARGDAVPLWDRRGGALDRECYAVRFRARGHEWLVTWRHGAPAMRRIEIRLDANEAAAEDAIVVSGDGEAPPRAPRSVTVRAH